MIFFATRRHVTLHFRTLPCFDIFAADADAITLLAAFSLFSYFAAEAVATTISLPSLILFRH